MSNAFEKGAPIVVVILGNDQSPCPECRGAPQASLVEGVRLALAERYGPSVRIEYRSLWDAATADRHQALIEQARNSGVPLPLTVVDGALVQGGGIDYRTIMNAIDLKLETGGEPEGVAQ